MIMKPMSLRVLAATLAGSSMLWGAALHAKAKITFLDCQIDWSEKAGSWNSGVQLRKGRDQNSFKIDGDQLLVWLPKVNRYAAVCEKGGMMYVPDSATCTSKVSKKKWTWEISDPQSKPKYHATGVIDIKARTITKEANYTLGNGTCVAGSEMR